MLGFLTIPWLGPKYTEPRATLVPKVKLGHIEPRALSGYLTPSNCYIGFPYCPLVRPKTHGTACDIGPKGEARTHGTACTIGPKGEARTHGTLCAIGPNGKDRTIHQCSYITLCGSAALVSWFFSINNFQII